MADNDGGDRPGLVEARREAIQTFGETANGLVVHALERTALMNNPLEVCLAEAAKARAEAEVTTLPNVRDRLLRSATAWEAQASNERRFAHLPSRATPAARQELA